MEQQHSRHLSITPAQAINRQILQSYQLAKHAIETSEFPEIKAHGFSVADFWRKFFFVECALNGDNSYIKLKEVPRIDESNKPNATGGLIFLNPKHKDNWYEQIIKVDFITLYPAAMLKEFKEFRFEGATYNSNKLLARLIQILDLTTDIPIDKRSEIEKLWINYCYGIIGWVAPEFAKASINRCSELLNCIHKAYNDGPVFGDDVIYMETDTIYLNGPTVNLDDLGHVLEGVGYEHRISTNWSGHFIGKKRFICINNETKELHIKGLKRKSKGIISLK